jgi:hypothetical protein
MTVSNGDDVTHFAIEGAAVMGAVCASAPASGWPVYCPRIESMRCFARMVSVSAPPSPRRCKRPLVTSTPRSAPFQR